MRIHRIVDYGPSGCTIFFSHYLTDDKIFKKKIENKIFVLCPLQI